MEILQVTIRIVNGNGKITANIVEVETWKEAARLMLTYRPKRGSKVFAVEVEEVSVLI